jgi:pyruvate, water dikinase
MNSKLGWKEGLKMIFIRPFSTLSKKDVAIVGGKNASLGEMIGALSSKGIKVPDGFATTADAYHDFLKTNSLQAPIKKILESKDSLQKKGEKIRELILDGSFSPPLKEAITKAYYAIGRHTDVAIRSSATAEDLPEASFAGQQETFLHIRGIDAVLSACKKCFASLFTDRAISYREIHKFDHLKVALSVGVQLMVRSDKGSAGVIFTLDPETGFRNVVVINGSWGLGETVVQGTVIPDEFILFKPTLTLLKKMLGSKEKQLVYSGSHTKLLKTPEAKRSQFVLTDDELKTLAKWSIAIEKHYGCPMDIEWAKDGITKKMYIVQARPETVQSQKKASQFITYEMKPKAAPLLTGLAIGESIATGPVQVISSAAHIKKFKSGSILVTPITSPDWVPIMKQARGIITDLGGRTSHAAIVSRELGIPAIVGTTNATTLLKNGQEITLSCAEGSRGAVYAGVLPFQTQSIDLTHLPNPPVPLFMNISSPDEAWRWWHIPCQGIGLARMEFIINNIIQIHPMALIHPEKVTSEKARKQIKELTQNFPTPQDYFIDTLSRGLAQIAAVRFPDPVIVRFSDFKTNEYARLIGGEAFEPHEENPMLGFRGASRYYNEKYREGFALECKALKKARETLGLTNIIPMIPFCRTLEEADLVLKTCAAHGLERGKHKLQIYMMAEIPSNIILAEEFATRFDGFSIGSNDLTQLILGIDRDSAELAPLFDERNPAVTRMIHELIQKAHAHHCKVGICGQAPSDYPDFASFLIKEKIDSISLSPDRIIPLLLSQRK